MIYKTFKNLKLSTLGMGNMRLPIDANRVIHVQSVYYELYSRRDERF